MAWWDCICGEFIHHTFNHKCEITKNIEKGLNEYQLKMIKRIYCHCLNGIIRDVQTLCGVCQLIKEIERLKKQ